MQANSQNIREGKRFAFYRFTTLFYKPIFSGINKCNTILHNYNFWSSNNLQSCLQRFPSVYHLEQACNAQTPKSFTLFDNFFCKTLKPKSVQTIYTKKAVTGKGLDAKPNTKQFRLCSSISLALVQPTSESPLWRGVRAQISSTCWTYSLESLGAVSSIHDMVGYTRSKSFVCIYMYAHLGTHIMYIIHMYMYIYL